MQDAAYFVSPPSGPGHPVLLLHSWWGLDGAVRRMADRISDEGYTVLVPDLLGGATSRPKSEPKTIFRDLDPNRLASLTQTGVLLVQERSIDPPTPISVVGMSMGASLGLWASIRQSDAIARVVSFYGVQTIDFAGASASYQLHFADDDALVDSEEASFMEATIGLNGLEVESYRYPDTAHWFFEEGRPNYDPVASETAWQRLLGFLAH